MRGSKVVSVLGVSAILVGVLASSLGAQNGSGRGAPSIRVYSRTGTGVVSNYVEPAIEVSENAYVFAVSLDLDGQIQVLQPDFPGISVQIARGRELRLPNFFAGFANGRSGVGTAYGYNAGYAGSMVSAAGQENDTRGTVIALASRAPFNLDRIERGGDWNITAIRGLIEYRSPESAAQALASYLGAKGEPIGRDYMRYAGGRQNYYASDYLGGEYACYSNSSIYALSVVSRIRQLRAGGQNVRIAGYDYCGMPIVVWGPSGRGRVFQPANPLPVDTGDSRNRLGHGAPPRSGNKPPSSSAALGFFPPPRHAATPPQVGDVTVTAPAPPRRGRDPREVLMELQNQGNGSGFGDRDRVPRGSAPPRSSTAAIGAEAVQNFNRPVLRAAPPVQRTEPMTSAPPRAAAPAPPPPRAAEPHTTTTSNPPPPPRQ